MKPTERFSNRADHYRHYRPGYPVGVITLMLDECGLSPGAAIADIGSGTGILTRLLLEAGFDVTAVEPNDAMRNAAEEDLRGFPKFHSVNATAEQTGLADRSFDAITVAQAFHWFDHEAARREFARLLRPNGWVFIIRNRRLTDSSPFAADYERLLATLGETYTSTAHRDEEASRRSREVFFAPGSLSVALFDNPQIMDWPALRGRFLSSSYVPAEGDPKHEDYLRRLEEIFQTHAVNDRVTFDQVTEVHCGRI